MNWNNYPNFTKKEFDCKETGENDMHPEFMHYLQQLRDFCGFPFIISSGYRSVNHSAEKNKTSGGTHTQGIACDVRVYGERAHKLVTHAMRLGFTGIGVNQKGPHASRFIHLDIRNSEPTIWSY